MSENSLFLITSTTTTSADYSKTSRSWVPSHTNKRLVLSDSSMISMTSNSHQVTTTDDAAGLDQQVSVSNTVCEDLLAASRDGNTEMLVRLLRTEGIDVNQGVNIVISTSAKFTLHFTTTNDIIRVVYLSRSSYSRLSR